MLALHFDVTNRTVLIEGDFRDTGLSMHRLLRSAIFFK